MFKKMERTLSMCVLYMDVSVHARLPRKLGIKKSPQCKVVQETPKTLQAMCLALGCPTLPQGLKISSHC